MAGSAHHLREWPYSRTLLLHRPASRSALLLPCFMFSPSPLRFQHTTTSAAICRPIPAPYDADSPSQDDRLPRVIRATFTAYIRRIYVPTFRMVSGFEFHGPLAQMGPPLSAGCSSDRSFAYSFLQIPPRDGHPCCSARSSQHQGLLRDLHPKVSEMATTDTPVALMRYAPCPAQPLKRAARGRPILAECRLLDEAVYHRPQARLM